MAVLGGWLFHSIHFPLPWILGPLSVLLTVKAWKKKQPKLPSLFRNTAYVALGCHFGLSLSLGTFQKTAPLLLPYMACLLLLIAAAAGMGAVLARMMREKPITGVLGAVPGGLAEMVAASENLKANTSQIALMHTVRLLAVVFTVPSVISWWFVADFQGVHSQTAAVDGAWYTILGYVIAGLLGWLMNRWLPVAFIIVPMLVVAAGGAVGIDWLVLPEQIIFASQLVIGIHLTRTTSIEDIVKGAKYLGWYILLSLLVIAASFGLGILFSYMTHIPVQTAILCFAPGGLPEMVITGTAVGGDPELITAFQFVRLLTIIIGVPLGLKWLQHRGMVRGEVTAS
ncbi:AbrB family transcriptional regulator [Marinicrinis lubricantis]